jgi:hypothetical protein
MRCCVCEITCVTLELCFSPQALALPEALPTPQSPLPPLMLQQRAPFVRAAANSTRPTPRVLRRVLRVAAMAADKVVLHYVPLWLVTVCSAAVALSSQPRGHPASCQPLATHSRYTSAGHRCARSRLPGCCCCCAHQPASVCQPLSASPNILPDHSPHTQSEAAPRW